MLICSFAYAHQTSYDVIVIGGGPAGIIAAQAAHAYGKNVAIVDQTISTKSKLGQSDLPVKSLIKASQIAETIYKSHLFGLPNSCTQEQADGVLSYIRETMHKAEKLYDLKLQELSYITAINGHATFIDPHTIEVNDQQLKAHRFIIATGGKPRIPNIPGIHTCPYYTKNSFFKLKNLPQSVVIIGQGPLGVEFATAFHRLGVETTLLVKHGLILPHYDYELVSLQYRLLKQAGINLNCNVTVQELRHENNMIQATYRDHMGKITTSEHHALIIALDCLGNTEHMGLEKLGVVIDDDGIVVDTTMKSSIDSIYACGDVVGRMYTLTRVAYYQAHIAAHNACKPFYTKALLADYSNVSSLVQSILPLGSLGITEQEARKLYGDALLIYRYSYDLSVRAIIDNATEGFAKCICSLDGTLLGVHVMGEGADQLIDNMHVGQNFNAQFEHYLQELHTSPNYLDGVWQIAQTAPKKSSSPLYAWYIAARQALHDLFGF